MGAEPKQHPAPPGPTSATCPLIQRPSRLWRSASRHKQTTTKGRPTDEDGKQGPDPATDGEPKSRREQPAVVLPSRNSCSVQLLAQEPAPPPRHPRFLERREESAFDPCTYCTECLGRASFAYLVYYSAVFFSFFVDS